MEGRSIDCSPLLVRTKIESAATAIALPFTPFAILKPQDHVSTRQHAAQIGPVDRSFSR